MSTAVAVQPQKRKGLLGNEKGLTLIELLAVIVILAIIAAIAIPSIGGIINRTKKESHRANAQIIVDAARYAVTAEGFPMVGKTPADGTVETQNDSKVIQVSLDELNTKGYLENVPKDPENSPDTYDKDASYVKIYQINATGKYRYQIYLKKADGNVVFGGETWEDEIRTKDLNGSSSSSPSP